MNGFQSLLTPQFIAQVGVPTLINVFLILALLGYISSPLMSELRLNSGQNAQILKNQDRLETYVEIVCVNTAKDPAETEQCRKLLMQQ